MKLVLASASPRRREILSTLGLSFDVLVSRIEERRADGESPADYVRRLSREKAQSVALARQDACVLGADTVVVLEGDVLEKPRDVDDAYSMILRLGGRAHEVLTGVSLVVPGTQTETRVVKTRVSFCAIDAESALAYAKSGEGLDKAGAYAVQGLGAGFVERIEGSYTNVVGLPASDVVQMLRAAGVLKVWP